MLFLDVLLLESEVFIQDIGILFFWSTVDDGNFRWWLVLWGQNFDIGPRTFVLQTRPLIFWSQKLGVGDRILVAAVIGLRYRSVIDVQLGRLDLVWTKLNFGIICHFGIDVGFQILECQGFITLQLLGDYGCIITREKSEIQSRRGWVRSVARNLLGDNLLRVEMLRLDEWLLVGRVTLAVLESLGGGRENRKLALRTAWKYLSLLEETLAEFRLWGLDRTTLLYQVMIVSQGRLRNGRLLIAERPLSWLLQEHSSGLLYALQRLRVDLERGNWWTTWYKLLLELGLGGDCWGPI